MKKIIYTGLGAAALLAGTVAMAAPAMASAGPSGSNAQQGQLTGKGAISYPDGYFGTTDQCNETQHPAFDTVSCKFIDGTSRPDLAGVSGTVGWNSDWLGNPALLPSHSNVGVLTYTINADGTGYTGQATYPNG